MKTFGLFFLISWLIRTPGGQAILVAAVLWYLDDRYFGLLASLWAPVARWQRIASLKQSVAVNPSDVRSMVELGEHYLRAGQPQVATDYLERAADRGEDGARAQFLQGGALVRLGRHADGRKLLEAALAQTPTVAFGEPYVYLLEEAFATGGAHSRRVDELVGALDQFDGVEVLTRAGRICATAGRTDLARKLLEEAIRNYSYIPKKMRRRERRWLIRARLALWQLK